jgi:putative flippase GtrA
MTVVKRKKSGNGPGFFEKYKQGFIHFIKFNFVGIANTGITVVVYNILLFFKVSELVAYPIGYAVGLVNSYIMNKFWTFGDYKLFERRTKETDRKESKKQKKTAASGMSIAAFWENHKTSIWEACKFAIVNLLAFGGGQIFLWINKSHIGINPTAAQLLTLLYSIPTNFVGAKYWAFRKKIKPAK